MKNSYEWIHVGYRNGKPLLRPAPGQRTIHKTARYMLHPGYVVSPHDNQRHWVGALDLMALYRVTPQECCIYKPGAFEWGKYLHLYPSPSGHYELPSRCLR